MSDTLIKGHKQHDLYISDTVLNGVHHTYKNDLLESYGSHSGGSIDGIHYSYSPITKYWTISGTATSDSSLVILNSPYSIPSYIDKNHEFQLELDDFSEGSIIPLRITLYFSSSNSVQMIYPSNTDILSYKVQSNILKIPNDCTGLKLEYFVETGREVSAQLLYHFYDTFDNRITHYEYVNHSTDTPSTFQVVISGGSGSGSLTYEIEKITGDATISSSGAFTFLQPGTVWVKVQKAESQVGDTYYEQSKILILEVTLEQSQVWIKVQNDIIRNIGDEIPAASSAGYLVEGLLVGDSLSRDPDIYFVYQSEDFYRFDIMSQANSETRANNGIQYTNNNDGSWRISGQLTGSESTYGLILSTTELPSYIDRNHKYLFKSTGLTGDVKIRANWYFTTDNNVVTSTTSYSSSSTDFIIPSDSVLGSVSIKLTGFALEFCVTTSVQLNRTVTVKILDQTEDGRFIDKSREGNYPISAKNGQIPNNIHKGYKSKIQYRSKELKYTSETVHTLYSGMFLYDPSSGNLSDITYGLSISQKSALSRTKIVMHVKSPAGTYFQDGWSNTYITGDGSHSDFDNLWEPGVEVSLGINGSFVSGFFQILGSTTGDTDISQQVPFHRIDATTDSNDTTKVYEGTYEFMMPSSTIMISIVSYYITGSIYYRYYPYCDVGVLGDPLVGPAVLLPSTIYRDALMFCRWARQQYFGEVDAVPLMQGRTADTGSPYSGWFYVANPTAYSDPNDAPIIRHYVTRKEVCWVLRRMTHDTEFSSPLETIENISRYPDTFFELRASYQKDPKSRLFEYAGYPPENGVTVEWTQNLAETFSYDALYGDNLRWKPYVMVPDSEIPGLYHHINEGTIDDYLYNYDALSTLSWNAWIGVLNGMSNTVSAPESFASFQEIATLLWRYAKFRQFDVMGDRAYQEVDDSTASEWAKNGPIKWLISRGITTGYHVATSINPLGGQKMKPQDYIDRADFAYMIMKFCQMYAW